MKKKDNDKIKSRSKRRAPVVQRMFLAWVIQGPKVYNPFEAYL